MSFLLSLFVVRRNIPECHDYHATCVLNEALFLILRSQCTYIYAHARKKMEELLIPSDRNCKCCADLDKAAPLVFRFCRYGAMFSCRQCGSFITVAQALHHLHDYLLQTHALMATGDADFYGERSVFPHFLSVPVVVTASKSTSYLKDILRIRLFRSFLHRKLLIECPDAQLLLTVFPSCLAEQMHSCDTKVDAFIEANDCWNSFVLPTENRNVLVCPLSLEDCILAELWTAMSSTATLDSRWVLDPSPYSQHERVVLSVDDASRTATHPSDCGSEDSVAPRLWNTLLRHQREGVRRCLAFSGRILFGDEMGCGKTLQAIACLQALDNPFPVLLVCPAGLRAQWADLLETWWPSLGVDGIVVIRGFNDKMPQQDTSVVDARNPYPKIVITSFRMVEALGNDLQLRSWGTLLVDESHTLRPNIEGPLHDAKYTQILTHIGKTITRYCIMLSGTPSLSCPFGLFVQVDTIRPGLLGRCRYHFALNYCTISFDPFLSVSSCHRPAELNELLESRVLLRRTKDDVLNDLPPKRRMVLHVPDDNSNNKRQGDDQDVGVGEDIGSDSESDIIDQFDGNEDRKDASSFGKKYAHSWRHRQHNLKELISTVVEQQCTIGGTKVVLFAHHIDLLRMAQDTVKRCLPHGYSHIYIDGSVDPMLRKNMVDTFSSDLSCVVAIMGITAAAVGISLASATRCYFLEVPPDAAWLQQAEDRLHRPGQRSCVYSIIVVGSTSWFDAKMLNTFRRSIRSTSEVLDRQSNDRRALLLDISHAEASSLSLADGDNAREREEADPWVDIPEWPLPQFSSAAELSLDDVLFRISAVTHRIHVGLRMGPPPVSTELPQQRAENVEELGSVALDDIRNAVLSTTGDEPIQQKMDDIDIIQRAALILEPLLKSLSSFTRREWIRSKCWLNTNQVLRMTKQEGISILNGKRSREPNEISSARRLRYAPTWKYSDPEGVDHSSGSDKENVDDDDGGGTVELRQHYGPWSIQRVTYRVGAVKDYPVPLRWESAARGFVRLCATCKCCIYPQLVAVLPGTIHPSTSDDILFCSGRCREAFFIRRSHEHLRRTIGGADHGVCACCGVDCDALVRELQQASTIDERKNILVNMHPQFLVDAPVHAEALLRRPEAGACWNVDHIVPVSQGGGQSSQSNLQTLCVPCHVNKTRMEAAAGSGSAFGVMLSKSFEDGQQDDRLSTVESAVRDMLSGDRRRRRRRVK